MLFLDLNFEQNWPIFHQQFQEELLQNGEIFRRILTLNKQYVNVLFCSCETIQNLNQQFRGQNKPTDVLSWEYGNIKEEFDSENKLWGEIAICVSICQQQAKKHCWSFQIEVYRLLIHGLVHLTGSDHQTNEEEKKMLELENKLLAAIGYDFIYQPTYAI